MKNIFTQTSKQEKMNERMRDGMVYVGLIVSMKLFSTWFEKKTKNIIRHLQFLSKFPILLFELNFSQSCDSLFLYRVLAITALAL